ncbi:putative bifunctional diguanylate cyclase/phosphodiesterase [Sphingomicrobium aestuariivivum]|uniref:putative bifunctional diguanylate cyclase/phosphodiesterase n=1 Tax=Sphingomicrobium aestuariivivum TaxID=1582356 RepID=UPI001FD68139|nr:bifunctional diguanylate cyclase/phosphodiesterase [Sphingomicrobium aestuariivivum]MCJ8191839.1 bifunctional diguanylate cyclase/phosphodiesterase [Sphingomicrobium aestuariivivum]
MQATVPLQPAPVASAPRNGRGMSVEDCQLLAALPIAAGVVHLDEEGELGLDAWNPKFIETITGGQLHLDARAILKAAAGGPIGAFLKAYLADPANAPDEMERQDGSGVHRRYFRLKAAPLGGAGAMRRCLLSLVEETQEKRTQEHLRNQMLQCSLTGLPNRLAFTDAIEAVAGDKARADGYAILLVDLLRFSRINQSMGSVVGDELLISFASRLVGGLRDGDMLARVGGNEFGILFSVKGGAGDAVRAAERIARLIEEPFTLSDLDIRVDGAIGIALLSHGEDGEELFRNAQFAVKQAKLAGKPTIYEPEQAVAARRRFSIETELRRALERDELDLAYQPLIELKTGRVTGFEALARWNHAERGEIGPSEFIPVAEESGLILELGRWAMDKAARTLSGWDNAEGQVLPINLSVNLSAIQVARDNVSEMVGTTLRTHKIGGERLTIELTESAIVQDPARATKVFEAIKGLDANLAMDDFGTGYSSLAYLQRLPIDLLKIDQRFIKGMLSDRDSIAIVRAILGLADALGMKTTAEGIESVELATTLAGLGCAHGQGFHFSKAVDAKRALAYWRAREEKALREGTIAASPIGRVRHGRA